VTATMCPAGSDTLLACYYYYYYYTTSHFPIDAIESWLRARTVGLKR
jgi:hypothetical protein